MTNISLELETYNEWNLPFAKSVTCKANNATEFPTDVYLLEVDMSAYFSVIFVSTDF